MTNQQVDDHPRCAVEGVDVVDQDVKGFIHPAKQTPGGSLCAVFVGRGNEKNHWGAG
ncbi:MAG: hypothetical protein ACJARS_003838 [bacterium]|jgi:hypothetical protein